MASGDAGAQALSEYDSLTANKLEATLESADAPKARIRLKGQIQGSARGGVGKMSCEGFLTFDLNAALVDHLDLNRVESRQAGPVEAGLDIKSTLTVTRQPAEWRRRNRRTGALAGIPRPRSHPSASCRDGIPPAARQPCSTTGTGTCSGNSEADRPEQRLNGGQVIAQCNLMVGPDAGKGRHSSTRHSSVMTLRCVV